MPVILPWQQVEQHTLLRLIEELVSRDGTDYGDQELSQQQKCRQALMQLKQGRAVLCWDEDNESASLISKEEFSRMQQEGA